MTTRERKLKFIDDGGENTLQHRVLNMLSTHGEGWLTDDQIIDIVRDQIDNWKRTQRMNRQNREIASARRAGDAA